MRIGLFGGTFDPIHWGHLRSAEEVREALSLDRVLFIPTARPPHKRSQTLTSASHRLAMVRRAVASNPSFSVSTVEISRRGLSYSIDTLRYFTNKSRGRDSYFFILGYDAFREIESWKDYQEIFALCHFVVTSRPGSGPGNLLRRLPVAVRMSFCYARESKAYRHRSGTFLYFVKVTDIAVSASEIRRRSREGRSIRYLVPLEVEAYIEKRGIYKVAQEGR
jgi:nicotinate-nucleotide adenylyltransferase